MDKTYLANLILQILAQNENQNITFEELTKLTVLYIDTSYETTEVIQTKREHQITILESLILLHDNGLINLNPETDESVITAAGLKKIKTVTFGR